MSYIIRVKRQSGENSKPYWQEFEYSGASNASVASVLHELNGREVLTDMSGSKAELIAWECSCMVRKCGACAMRINGIPRLACSAFLNEIKGNLVILEPLSKFPLVKDLIIDRSVLFDTLKKAELWLQSDAYFSEHTHDARYQSARCLMCGCCLEVCPNFCPGSSFGGAIIPVNTYRIMDEEQQQTHREAVASFYQKSFFEGCGKSLSCQNICPAGIPVEELTVRTNAAAVWKR